MESCASKKDQRFRFNHFVGNQNLKDALHQYDNLHKQCYERGIVEDLGRIVSSEKDMKCKYIYINFDHAGFGNRVMTLISYFLLAIMTNRVLLLQSHEYNLGDLFCQPFIGSDWLIPENFNYMIDIVGNTSRKDLHLKGINLVQRSWIQSVLTPQFFSPDINSRQIWYLQQQEQYIVPLFFLNSLFNENLTSWFPDHNVATPLIRHLLHPTDSIWSDIIDSYISRDMKNISVGVHLRWVRGNILGESDCFDDVPNEAHFFIASLENLTEYPVFKQADKRWTVHQKYAETSESYTDHEIRSVIHDVWLLSMADKVILSHHSTFSYTIMSLRGELCEMLMHRAEPPKCITMLSQEPCCHVCQAFKSAFYLPDEIKNLESFTHNESVVAIKNQRWDHIHGGKFMRCEEGVSVKLAVV